MSICSPLDLLELIIGDYAGTLDGCVLADLNKGHMRARICIAAGSTVLLIRGTDERGDWYGCNLRPFPFVEPGDTRRWHNRWLRHAWAVHALAVGWIEAGRSIDVVTGHSLGAAVAQIVGPGLGLSTITFASPKPLWLWSGQPINGDFVTNYVRPDDLVPKMPPLFWRVGETVVLNPKDRLWPLEAHAAVSYRAAFLELPPATDTG